jgi:hypothetical protein
MGVRRLRKTVNYAYCFTIRQAERKTKSKSKLKTKLKSKLKSK